MKYIPLDKRSKKKQKTYYAAQRSSWNGTNPVTKIVPSKKIYNRKRAKQLWKSDALPDVDYSAVPCFGMDIWDKSTPSRDRSFIFRSIPPA